MAGDNKSLGRFILDGILPAPRGVPQIEVTFDIDANGIVNVSAADKATGKKQHITIQSSSGLDESAIQRMVREADEHASEDERKRKEIEVRNQADSLVYQTEKLLRENGDKIPAPQKQEVESAVQGVKDALARGDVAAIEAAIENVTKVTHKLSEAMYQAATGGKDGGKDGGGPTPPPSEGGEDIIDAEFEETR
jgi:molecular chaperone DnaK